MSHGRQASGRGFRQLDHTADLALEICAENEVGLLEEGARAIISLVTEGATVRPVSERRVHLEALDREDRLVQWLNEVLVLAVSAGFVTASVRVSLTERGLDATLWGEPEAAARVVTELKSVTYHDLFIGPRAGERNTGWVARVVIDV